MKLAIAALVLSQTSHALHIKKDIYDTESRQLKHTAEDDSINFADATSTNGPNSRKPKKPLPWWKLPNTDNGEMNAISWSQFLPIDTGDDSATNSEDTGIKAGNSVCPINQCKSGGVLEKYYCGANAGCINNYCRCNFGWKSASGVPTSRGWSGLEALTVWVDDHSSGCTERCDTLSCSEVAQVQGCFDQHVPHADNVNEGDQGRKDQGSVETDFLHLGAIKAPGVDAGIGT